jgi:hypothetical protein
LFIVLVRCLATRILSFAIILFLSVIMCLNKMTKQIYL